jgi:hypothetical protein
LSVVVFAVFFRGPHFAGVRAGEESPTGPERFSLLVEALDAGSRDRAGVLVRIDGELRGPEAAEMRAALLDGFATGGLLIQLGAAEALARYADPRDLPLFRSVIESSDRLAVKVAAIRFLPAFILGNSERARFAYIRNVASDDVRRDESAVEPLSRPPLTRRGRLDMELAGLRRQVSSIVIGQFDPVGSAIASIDDPRFGLTAGNSVRGQVGAALGVDPGRWREIWDSHSTDMQFSRPEEIEEVVTTALGVLGDLGLPADASVFPGLDFLFRLENPLVAHAALESLRAMCLSATRTIGAFLDGAYGSDWTEAESGWLRGREDLAAELWLFTARHGAKLLDSPDPALAHAAVLAVGAAIGFSPRVAARRADLRDMSAMAVEKLESMALLAGLGVGLRCDVLRALGRSGSRPALAAVLEIMGSAYAGSGRDGLAVAEAGVAALAEMANGDDESGEAARAALLGLLSDAREYPAGNSTAPPVMMGHIVLWRLQRIAKSGEITFDAGFWRRRLGWDG